VYVAVLPTASATPTSRPASSYTKKNGPVEGESAAVAVDAPVASAEAPLAAGVLVIVDPFC
jgi:hypothetical protein